MASISKERAGERIVAFLDMLSHSEGTDKYPHQGYNTIVGGEQFGGYADHPRKLVTLPNLNIKSTAAGRYQLLARYYDSYKKLLDLKDFSPISQDLIAIQQMREQKALTLINDGNVQGAIETCSNIWASLPGAGYGQREAKLDDLLTFYDKALA